MFDLDCLLVNLMGFPHDPMVGPIDPYGRINYDDKTYN